MLAFQEFREEKITKSMLQNSGIAHVSNRAPFGLCFAARATVESEGQLHWTITTLSSTNDFP